MPLNQTQFRVTVNGQDISTTLAPIGDRIQIRDASGAESDTADIELDDKDGLIAMPAEGVSIEISLTGTAGQAVTFKGTVDKVRSKGSRGSGRKLSISAKGVNTLGEAKVLKERHWDDATVGQVFSDAATDAGISKAKVDPTFAGIKRTYVAQQSESFTAFGQRLARELGGTFKVAGDTAMLLKRGAGTSASGAALTPIEAKWGDNLIEWDISPIIGRTRYGSAQGRVYDPKTGSFTTKSASPKSGRAGPVHVSRFPAGDSEGAQAQADADASESDRQAGAGSVTIDAEPRAKPEAQLTVVGARPGIDGSYRITAVEHSLDRSGLTTKVELGEPSGSAGKDDRKA